MDLMEYATFANENPVCYIATAEGDQPRVRPFMMWFADENGFYLATLSPKQVSAQLKSNPKVELCFYNNAADPREAKQMRVTGRVELVDDEGLRKKVSEERASLEQIAGEPIEPLTEVFRIRSGEAHFWTMADILREPELERIRF